MEDSDDDLSDNFIDDDDDSGSLDDIEDIDSDSDDNDFWLGRISNFLFNAKFFNQCVL